MLALYRTYRPSTFAEVTGQTHVTQTIQNQIHSGSVSHAYVFTGPRGIGKTTVARLLAKAVNCKNRNGAEPCNACDACVSIAEGKAFDVFEIDAASNTDVDNVRENIIRNVRFAPTQFAKKVYIIDEVHMLSTSSFNALLKTLEEPPAHVLFILATTEIHKVPATILSRCQRFDFKRISKDEMIDRLKMIVKKEKRLVEADVLASIAKHSGGCERDAESLLGQVLALDEGNITMEIATLVLPATTEVIVQTFLEQLEARDAKGAIGQLNILIEQGVDLTNFLDDVISTMRDRLLQSVSDPSPLQGEGEGGVLISFYRRAIELFLAARRHIRTDDIPQLPAELAIVELCLAKEPSLINDSTTPPLHDSTTFKQQGVDSDTLDMSSRAKRSEVEGSPTSSAGGGSAFGGNFQLPTSTVFDSIPVLSLEEVKEKWPMVFEQIQECNASLPLFLQSCEVHQVIGECVELTFGYDLYVQTVNKEKNRRLVESVLERVLGKTVKVRAVLSEQKKEDETVSSLLDAFGGSVA